MFNMGLSNRVQAVLVAFGTAAAAIPDFVPPEYKIPIAVTAWLRASSALASKKRWVDKRLMLRQKREFLLTFIKYIGNELTCDVQTYVKSARMHFTRAFNPFHLTVTHSARFVK
jgi:hypothetical protein